MMSRHEQNKRRALIIRRQSAYRIGQAQREIWRKRKAAQGQDFDDAGSLDEDALLGDLPDSLLV